MNFIKDILPKIGKYSKKLDDLAILTNQHWIFVDKSYTSKVVFIFRSNSDLIISVNGKVEKGKWTYLGNDYLLIEKPNESHLYKHGFFDDTVLALKVDGTLDFAFFVNETKIGKELNTLDNILNYLDSKYISRIYQPNIEINLSVFTEDMNPVLNEMGKWGYYSSANELIIPHKFDVAYRFIKEYAVAVVANKYGMIDKQGNFIINAMYEFLEPFSEGLALARLNKKFGFIDKENKVQHEFIYDNADSFDGGQAKVWINDKVKFIKR